MNALGMTPKQYDRHLRTRPAYETDPALFDAMDRNARAAWIKAFRQPRKRRKFRFDAETVLGSMREATMMAPRRHGLI